MDEHIEKAGAALIERLEFLRHKRERIATVQAEITYLHMQLESAKKEFEYLRTQDDLLGSIIKRGL